MTHHDSNAKALLQSALKRNSRPDADRAQAARAASSGPLTEPAKAGAPLAVAAIPRRSPMAFRAGRRF